MCSIEGCGRKYHANNLCNSHCNKQWGIDNPEKVRAKSKRTRKRNREKLNAKAKKKYWKNPKEMNEKSRQYYKKNSDKVKGTRILRVYNITLDQYNQMFIEQNGNCAICNRNQSEFLKDLSIDHCHETGKIKGLLCINCNTAIGSLK